MSRGRKSPAIRLSKIPKNKGHTPAKEHMTSAAEQHGAAASRNACAPRMLYICCRPCTIKWLCTNDGRDRPAKAHPASTGNGHPFRFCCCLLGSSTREIYAAFISLIKYDLFLHKKEARRSEPGFGS